MLLNIDMNNVVLWTPSKIKSFYFDFLFKSKEDFKEIVLRTFSPGNNYSILVRVEYNDSKYAMLGTQIPFSFNDISDTSIFDSIYNKIIDRLNELYTYYEIESIDSIQVLFVDVKLLPKLLLTDINNITLPKISGISNKDIKYHYNSNLLPLTVNTNYFGKFIIGDDCIKYMDMINEKKKLLLKPIINISDFDSMYLYNNNYLILNKQIEYNIIKREVYDSKLGIFEGSFMDTIWNHEDNSFERMYKDVTFSIINSKLSRVNISKHLPAIEYSSGRFSENAWVSNPYIGTFDLEVYEDDNGYSKVYAAGFCINDENPDPVMFYLENPSYDNVLIECINTMLNRKYNGYTFYIHNLNYDGVFIMYHLKLFNRIKGFEYYKINAFYRDSSILKLEISIERTIAKSDDIGVGVGDVDGDDVKVKSKRKSRKSDDEVIVRRKPRDIKITFVDSANLLKGRLRDLCEAFNIDIGKGYFPYKFVRSDTLKYVGQTPSYSYWSDISKDDYNLLVKDNWNLKEECLMYLSKDLTSLLQIIVLFNQYIHRKFDIQITQCLTISRLSLNIFLKNYLGNVKLPQIKGNRYDDIKNAYYGGVTEVYKPYGTDLYYYDVNSLYPFVALNPMCGNNCTYLESYEDRGLNIDELFGFFYCEIEASNNYLGLLPVRVPEGLIMPLGKWSGWYFSEELKFAISQGYKVKVIKGYNFDKVYNVFDKYVKDLYEIKSTTTNSVEKAIVKSLLNNLLGRFGLNINKPITEIVDKNKLDILLTTRECNSFKRITDNDYLISYNPNISKSICESYGYDYMKVLEEFKPKYESDSQFKDVSLVISAAVTSYARIYMSKVKLDILNKGGNIYYTDTDSIVTDIPLNSTQVGKDLGQFKLEYQVRKGYFISNKTYALLTNDNKVVIKNKGILENSLTFADFVNLYKGIDVEGIKRTSKTTYDKGTVNIRDENIKIFHDVYTKRSKIYNLRRQWVDTRPLYIDNNNKPFILHNKLERRKSKNKFIEWFISYIKYILSKVFSSLFLIFSGIILVSLLGDSFDLSTNDIDNTIENNSVNTVNIKSIENNSVNTKSVKHNPIKVNKYSNIIINNKLSPININKYSINKYDISTYRDLYIKGIYENLVREMMSITISNYTKFDSVDSMKSFSSRNINNMMKSGKLNITISEYIKLIEMVDNIKSNTKLYPMICKDLNSLVKGLDGIIEELEKGIKKPLEVKSDIPRKIRYDPDIVYNITSDKVLNDYIKWVQDPYNNKYPFTDNQDIILSKKRLTLSDELSNTSQKTIKGYRTNSPTGSISSEGSILPSDSVSERSTSPTGSVLSDENISYEGLFSPVGWDLSERSRSRSPDISISPRGSVSLERSTSPTRSVKSTRSSNTVVKSVRFKE